MSIKSITKATFSNAASLICRSRPRASRDSAAAPRHATRIAANAEFNPGTQSPCVRVAAPGDAACLFSTMQKLLREEQYLLLKPGEGVDSVERQRCALEQMATSDARRVFVAMWGSACVGYIGVSKCSFRRNRHVGNFAMAVDPNYRRRGMATALLKAAEDWLRLAGVQRVEMTVVRENRGAIKLYKSAGFRSEGIRRKSFLCDGRFLDELYMAKEIT